MHVCDRVCRGSRRFNFVHSACGPDGRPPRQIGKIVDVVGRFFGANPTCRFGFHSESAELNAEGVKIFL